MKISSRVAGAVAGSTGGGSDKYPTTSLESGGLDKSSTGTSRGAIERRRRREELGKNDLANFVVRASRPLPAWCWRDGGWPVWVPRGR